MPAKSVVERLSSGRELDVIAIPLLHALGVTAAYQEALRHLSMRPQPARSAAAPANSSLAASLPLFGQE
jgi:hypothetical protein